MKNTYILTKKEQLTEVIWDFWFVGDRLPRWASGQYMEWVLPHNHADPKGIQRFFTIASSQTERELMFATKIIAQPSSFKSALRDMKVGDKITARGVDGDFVLPRNLRQKLVFIAGGIGITPFRAMAKYLIDTNEKRDIVLLYANKTSNDVAFTDLFNQAQQIGVKTTYFSTESSNQKMHVPGTCIAVSGLIDGVAIKKYVPDWQDRAFYIAGPEPMVENHEKMLKAMGIKGNNIKTDFFPGYES